VGAWLTTRKALLLDLDNTLYDWVAYFAPALRGMCRALSEATGLSTGLLFEEFKTVFAKHGTVEYSFALQELPSLTRLHPGASDVALFERYRGVVEVFQHRRRAYLQPYPGVLEGISLLHRGGYAVIGVTDGRRFQAENRLRQLGLDTVMDGLCCVSDHAVPDAETVAAIRQKEEGRYRSAVKRVHVLPSGLRKPSPEVLDYVLRAEGIPYEAGMYVGDSLAKDILMAQRAGIYDCWARYGARVSPLDFATLVRVTDWPPKAVNEALNPSPQRLGILPSFVADSFDDVVRLALMAPDERPPRHVPARPRQLAFAEIGPTMVKGGARAA